MPWRRQGAGVRGFVGRRAFGLTVCTCLAVGELESLLEEKSQELSCFQETVKSCRDLARTVADVSVFERQMEAIESDFATSRGQIAEIEEGFAISRAE
eukprot:462136-Hanusia_phi.AAC.2